MLLGQSRYIGMDTRVPSDAHTENEYRHHRGALKDDLALPKGWLVRR